MYSPECKIVTRIHSEPSEHTVVESLPVRQDFIECKTVIKSAPIPFQEPKVGLESVARNLFKTNEETYKYKTKSDEEAKVAVMTGFINMSLVSLFIHNAHPTIPEYFVPSFNHHGVLGDYTKNNDIIQRIEDTFDVSYQPSTPMYSVPYIFCKKVQYHLSVWYTATV